MKTVSISKFWLIKILKCCLGFSVSNCMHMLAQDKGTSKFNSEKAFTTSCLASLCGGGHRTPICYSMKVAQHYIP